MSGPRDEIFIICDRSGAHWIACNGVKRESGEARTMQEATKYGRLLDGMCPEDAPHVAVRYARVQEAPDAAQ